MQFNGMWTLKFKIQLRNALFAAVDQMLGISLELPSTAEPEPGNEVQTTQQCFSVAGRKLEGAAEHLIDVSEKRICQMSFEFWSPHVIGRDTE